MCRVTSVMPGPAGYARGVRIHLLQVAYGDDEPVTDRVKRVADLVAAQQGADLVVLPELWAPGGFSYRTWAERAETITGPTITAIGEAAASIGATVHAGSIIETVPDDDPRSELPGARGETGRGLWNTSVLIGPDGAPPATYRKIHRFGFGQGEPTLLEAGEEVVTVDLPATTLGLATCYDLRFPELFRSLLDAGAKIVVVPAAWPQLRVEAWTLLGRARAIENQTVIVQCNTAGTHAGVTMGGLSQVVDARGTVLGQAAADRQDVLIVDVDLEDVDRWRHDFPVLADRRLGRGEQSTADSR